MEKLTTNWHIVRILQLALGVVLTGSYFFYIQDGITLAFGLILLMQAAFNVSCITGACKMPQQSRLANNRAEKEEEIEYDEIV